MSEKQLTPTQATIDVLFFDDDAKLCAAIDQAIASQYQFSAHHNGERWSLAVTIPPLSAQNAADPEAA